MCTRQSTSDRISKWFYTMDGEIRLGFNWFYHGEFDKCLTPIKNAMRIALYQIMFLNKIPHAAAINESVEIIKRIKGDKSAGIVNGVLRNITRNLDNIRYPNPEEDKIWYYSVIYSHPKWLVKHWMDIMTEEQLELFYKLILHAQY